MEGLRLSRGIGLSTAAVVLVCALFVTIPQVSSVRYIVGSGLGGWTSNVNYTIWARDKHFYLGDWLCNYSLLFYSQICTIFSISIYSEVITVLPFFFFPSLY